MNTGPALLLVAVVPHTPEDPHSLLVSGGKGFSNMKPPRQPAMPPAFMIFFLCLCRGRGRTGDEIFFYLLSKEGKAKLAQKTLYINFLPLSLSDAVKLDLPSSSLFSVLCNLAVV